MTPRDADPLDVQPIEPEPAPRRGDWGCGSVVAWLLLCVVVLAGSATPREGPDIGSRTEGCLPSAGTTPALRGAPQRPVAFVTPTQDPARGARGAPPLQLAGGSRTGTAADVTYSGIVNYADPIHGRYYLAIPDGRGVRVEICGPGGCLIRTSTDAGPDLAMQRAGRIADLNSVDWLAISGVELKYGGFQGTILILRRPARIALPQTDTEAVQ